MSKQLWQTLGLGTVAGMRSMTAPAALSHALSKKKSKALKGTPFRYLQKSAVATGLKMLAAGEIVMDKMPGVPDRTVPPVLAGRILSGALVGSTIYKVNGAKPLSGALWGSLAAVASSYLMLYLRKELGHLSKLPDPAVALVEDAVAISSGLRTARKVS